MMSKLSTPPSQNVGYLPTSRKKKLRLETTSEIEEFVDAVYQQVLKRRQATRRNLISQYLSRYRDDVLVNRPARRRVPVAWQEGMGSASAAGRRSPEESVEPSKPVSYPRLPANDETCSIASFLYCQPCHGTGTSPRLDAAVVKKASPFLFSGKTRNVAEASKSSGGVAASGQGNSNGNNNSNSNNNEGSAGGASMLVSPRRAAASAALNKIEQWITDETPPRSKNKRNSTAAAAAAADRRGGRKEPFQFAVRLKMGAATKARAQLVSLPGPPCFLEGTHEPRPHSSATIFLKTHYATEDEQELKYVPYFGDDDKEDVVSELYNLEDREKQMEFGPEFRERDTNHVIDKTLLLIQKRMQQEGLSSGVAPARKGTSGLHSSLASDTKAKRGATSPSPTKQKRSTLQNRIHEALARFMDEDVDRIHERYQKVCIERHQQLDGLKRDVEDNDEQDEQELMMQKMAAQQRAKKSLTTKRIDSYLDAVDSYRSLLCRQCFTYDCNMHGMLSKPRLELQTGLSLERENDGYWTEQEKLLSSISAVRRETSDSENIDAAQVVEKVASATTTRGRHGKSSAEHTTTLSGKKRPLDNSQVQIHPPASLILRANEPSPIRELSPILKVLCERAFLMFQGDLDKMAFVLGVPRSLVEDYATKKDLKLDDYSKYVTTPHQGPPKKKKKNARQSQSMNLYNHAWLKRVEDAEIHPMFVPCDHEEPCSEETCSCIQNRFFCTKHCVWGPRSRNFFRGCNCAGKCTTKACSCFAAKRECDPDYCTSCGACTDPPNRLPTHQRCRNDNVGMRRHCHLLLAKSSIKDAGWGIYTKHALRRGDFIGEYVGEVISQEEAERRGRVYDKVNRSYLFNLTSDFVVDASRKGNKTRFANHSNKPNCDTRVVTVNGDAKIGLFAKEDIEAQSELFFDYRYDACLDNELIIKPGMTVDWQKDPTMANKISKKYSES